MVGKMEHDGTFSSKLAEAKRLPSLSPCEPNTGLLFGCTSCQCPASSATASAKNRWRRAGGKCTLASCPSFLLKMNSTLLKKWEFWKLRLTTVFVSVVYLVNPLQWDQTSFVKSTTADAVLRPGATCAFHHQEAGGQSVVKWASLGQGLMVQNHSELTCHTVWGMNIQPFQCSPECQDVPGFWPITKWIYIMCWLFWAAWAIAVPAQLCSQRTSMVQAFCEIDPERHYAVSKDQFANAIATACSVAARNSSDFGIYYPWISLRWKQVVARLAGSCLDHACGQLHDYIVQACFLRQSHLPPGRAKKHCLSVIQSRALKAFCRHSHSCPSFESFRFRLEILLFGCARR